MTIKHYKRGEEVEKRNLFQKVFGFGNESPKAKQPASSTQLKLLNDYTPVWNSYSGNVWDSDVVRAAVHTIASNVAKLKPNHIRNLDGNVMPTHSYIDRMLQNHPNEYETTYDFLYKVTSQLLVNNNAFVYVKLDPIGKILGFYSILYSSMELLEYQNQVYCRFTFRNSQKVTLPYSEIIHVRRHYQDSDFFGSPNTKPLDPTLQVINTVNSGIINSVKSSAYLRGLLKFTQTMLKPDDMKAQRDAFIADYMNLTNQGGIAVIDAKADFVPLDMKTTLIDEKTIRLVRDQIYQYFGVNEKIVQSDFTEEQYQAFYENVVQPIAMQLSQEFTNKCFTEKEKGFGNQIIFQMNHYAYMKIESKVAMIRELLPLSLLTLNEAREIFNLPNVENGDKRLMSLNYVDADKANTYQIGEQEDDSDEGTEDDGFTEDGDSSDRV